MIDQDRDLHPTFPLVRHVPIQEPHIFPLVLHRRQSQCETGKHETTDHIRVVRLLFFEEQWGPVGHVEIHACDSKDRGDGRSEQRDQTQEENQCLDGPDPVVSSTTRSSHMEDVVTSPAEDELSLQVCNSV